MPTRILLADDDAGLRRVIQFKLTQQGYEVVAVANGKEALRKIGEQKFDLLLSDMKMPEMDGIALLEAVRTNYPALEVILITAFATVSQAVQALKMGAFDYITKPFEDDDLFASIEKALRLRRLTKENQALKERLHGHDEVKRMVGVSPPFKEMINMIKIVAPTDSTILITGESGTGKELAARAIHFGSSRAGEEFVPVNCAAIPRDLIESELFGHLKGSFTGAIRDKKGKFELADRGTLFLDEIGELPLDLQAKLLRVIQEKRIEPVGSEKGIDVDIRLVAATNIDLKRKIAENRFREDLYYRLAVIPIEIPPLRSRPEDIAVLAREFVHKHAGRNKVTISDEMMNRLVVYDWPGNIRELENLIERMVVLRKSDYLTLANLPNEFSRAHEHRVSVYSTPATTHLTLPEAEKQVVLEGLKLNRWNISRTARYLNVPRHILVYRMKKHNLVRPA
jgi:two-component system NtrC family response regulator